MAKIKCKVCKKRFKATKENRYEVDRTPIFPLTALRTIDECFDCPYCGCQMVVNTKTDRSGKEDKQSIRDKVKAAQALTIERKIDDEP